MIQPSLFPQEKAPDRSGALAGGHPSQGKDLASQSEAYDDFESQAIPPNGVPRRPNGILPGLEREALTSSDLAPIRKQRTRQDIGRELASALLACPERDGRPLVLDLVADGESTAVVDPYGRQLVELAQGCGLVDPETGEVEEFPDLSPRAVAYSLLLRTAAEDGNHAGAIFDGQDGDQFTGGVALWKSSLRLDPNHLESFRRRSRHRARKSIRRIERALPLKERAARQKGYSWRLTWKLITLTMPHVPGATSEGEVARFNRAFRLLTKRPEWFGAEGCIKGVEDAITPSGPHVHGHLLALCRFVNVPQLRRAWWECLQKATGGAYGRPLEWMPGGLPFIDVRMVKRRSGEGVVSGDEALDEVTKYVTKPSDLLKEDEDGATVPASVLLELCEVARWPRMFELLGKAREARQGRRAAGAAPLDTSCISAGKARPEPPSFFTEAVEPEERDAVLARISSWEAAADRLIRESCRKKDRPPSWRDLLSTKNLADWCQVIAGRVKRGRNFRIAWLREHNPGLVLVTFDGEMHKNC